MCRFLCHCIKRALRIPDVALPATADKAGTAGRADTWASPPDELQVPWIRWIRIKRDGVCR